MKKWKFLFPKGKKLKTETWVLLLLTGVLLLVIALPTEKKEEKTEESMPVSEAKEVGTDLEIYIRKQEKRVEEILSAIEGAGMVQVMLTVESGGASILQNDTSLEKRNSRETDSEGGTGILEEASQSSQTVLWGDGNEPYVTEELCPKVTGIIVVAEGGDQASVKAEISSAMEALFDIPPHKIKVLKRVKEESEKGAVQ